MNFVSFEDDLVMVNMTIGEVQKLLISVTAVLTLVETEEQKAKFEPLVADLEHIKGVAETLKNLDLITCQA